MTQVNPTSQHPALIGYPMQAAFRRTLPKNKVYEHSGANARLKDLFVKQVEQIVWAYKLAPETLHLPARPGVPEIQVFSLQLNMGGLYEQLLRRLIPLPTRPRESLADLVTRLEQAQAKQRELDKISRRLAKEKQFNHKVEINAIVRKLQGEWACAISPCSISTRTKFSVFP